MAKTTIVDLKARFKRGMFPTEGDFANVFDSYVHKDDGIDIENVTTGNGSKTLTVLLQEIKEATVTEAVEAAKNEFPEIPELPEGLAEFIAKVNSFLDDADASDETINKWKEIEAFLSGITDTETLTGLLADLKQEILGEVDGKLEDKADKSTVEALDERVKALEEGSDEDESKLDCLKVIADLDASNAPNGTIAIYSGDTNDKYTHGFIYEKKSEGEPTMHIPSQTDYIDVPSNNYGIPSGRYFLNQTISSEKQARYGDRAYFTIFALYDSGLKYGVSQDLLQTGDMVWNPNTGETLTVTEILSVDNANNFVTKVRLSDGTENMPVGGTTNNDQYLLAFVDVNGNIIYYHYGLNLIGAEIRQGKRYPERSYVVSIPNSVIGFKRGQTSEDEEVYATSWTPLNVMNVIG